MKSGIYTITSPSGKQYVGSAKSFKNRWAVHRTDLRDGVHHNRPLQKAFDKYGEHGLVFARMIVCRPEDLLFYEQRAIDVLNPAYNICRIAGSPLGVKRSLEFGEVMRQYGLGRKLSAETCAKIAASLVGQKRTKPQIENMRKAQANSKPSNKAHEAARIANTGKKLSPAHVENMRKGMRGKTRDDAAKANMSAAAKAFCDANPEKVLARNQAVHCGRKRSAETCAKISAKAQGRTVSDETRKKLSVASTGRGWSEESKAKLSATKKRINQEKRDGNNAGDI